MGKMRDEIKALRRQNTHLQNVVQRQRQHLSELTGAIQFGEEREDCGTLLGYHLEIPAELVTRGLTDYTVQYELDKERVVYVIGVSPKE